MEAIGSALCEWCILVQVSGTNTFKSMRTPTPARLLDPFVHTWERPERWDHFLFPSSQFYETARSIKPRTQLACLASPLPREQIKVRTRPHEPAVI